MFIRGFLAVLAAVVLSTALVDTAQAYPVSARSGTSTVTGLYRPIDLNLSLTDGTDALDYCNGCFGGGASFLDFGVTLSGSFTGYDSSGPAGDWRLRLNRFSSSGFTDDGTTITVASTNVANSIGQLTFLGGGDYADLPYEDTPQDNDFFRIYATSTNPFLEVTCQDGTETCNSFVVRLLQDLQHIGPYIFTGGEGSSLDDGTACVFGSEEDEECAQRPNSRVNPECYAPGGELRPCGGISPAGFLVSSVPEPASMALVGMGLVALALGRRRQRQPRR